MRNRLGAIATVLGLLAVLLAGAYVATEFSSPELMTHVDAAENAAPPGSQDEHDHDAHAHESINHDEESHDGLGHVEDGHEDDGHDEHGHDEQLPVVRLSQEEQEALGVVIREASSGVLAMEIALPAEVRLNEDRVAHIVPRVSGIVRTVHKTIGDTVSEGELLAVLDSRELADVQAEYLAANARLESARKELSREKSLWEEEISAEKDYLAASREFEEAQILVRAAAQKLQALGVSEEQRRAIAAGKRDNLTRYEMTSPFAGEVIEKHIVLGENLEVQSNAFIIADLDSVWVDVRVYEKDLLRVRAGQTVHVSGPEGYSTVEGIIAYVAPVVDRETRTALARIVLPNQDRLWRPGLFLQVRLGIEDAAASVVVPKTAVQRLENSPVAFVEKGAGLQAVELTLGRETDDAVEVVAGLAPGERYVAEGAFALKAQIVTSNLDAHAGHGH